jgi:hypothetical protein
MGLKFLQDTVGNRRIPDGHRNPVPLVAQTLCLLSYSLRIIRYQ